MEFFKLKNAFKLRENDPKRRYFRHPVYCYVMVKLLLREVTVLFACTHALFSTCLVGSFCKQLTFVRYYLKVLNIDKHELLIHLLITHDP